MLSSFLRSLRIRIILDDAEIQTSRLGTRGVPADAGDGHLRFDHASTVGFDKGNDLVEVCYRDGDLGQRPAVADGGILDASDAAVDPWFSLGAGLDPVV